MFAQGANGYNLRSAASRYVLQVLDLDYKTVQNILINKVSGRRMKTQIITLESHDDLISVRDRLSWAKTPRILLVWPKYEKVTLRQVDLKILQRHASSLGAQLG